jgi:hypothetical protein
MSQSNSSRLDERHKATALAARKAMQEAVLTRARLGLDCCVSRDGKVVWLSPEEIFRTYHALPAELRAFDPKLLPPSPGPADSNLA